VDADATISARVDKQKLAHSELGVEVWRLRIYCAGFFVAFVLHLIADGLGHWPALSLVSVIAIAVGIWNGYGFWLRLGVILGVLHALTFPIFDQAITSGESIATVVAKDLLWPQLLVTLIGSRLLACEGKLAFTQFWQRPIQRHSAVEMQSVLSALVFGAFLTLVFYMAIPHTVMPTVTRTSSVITSAMLGGTIIHTTIIFLFFVIFSSVLDAVVLHVQDRSILGQFRRCIEMDQKTGSRRSLNAILYEELSTVTYARTFRVLSAAIEAKGIEGGIPIKLAGLSFDGFQTASRQFVRALLPFLPLLGFLGTVIGLATAISELPRGMTDGVGQGFDFSASLAGLAIKFETTLLGLIGSMICSLLLNFLEKREAELTAECMLIVKVAGERNV
jgi:hypothetical protein